MAWGSGPPTVVVGDVIAAATGNLYRDLFLETAPAKVTAAGDLVVGTGANAVGRLAAVPVGAVLKSGGVGAAPAWGVPSVPELSAGGAGQLVRTNPSTLVSEWFTPPACRVYHSASQAIAPATGTVLAFNSERFDSAAMHDTATNNSRITAPISGVYALTATVQWNSNASASFQTSLMLNGTTLIALQIVTPAAGGALNHGQVVAAIYKLAAGEYVEVYVYQATAGSVNVLSGGNYSPEFAAAWLGPG